MTFVLCNEGEKILLEAALGKVAAGALKLKLYTNDYTPVHTSVVADFTEMGAVQAYAEKTLATATWIAGVAGTGVGSAASNKASITYPQQTFTADGTGGAQTAYGYFITDNAETSLIGGERFSAAKAYASVGDIIKITPALRLGNEA